MRSCRCLPDHTPWVRSQVARSRTYTPTIDDVGYVLRYQVNIIDKAHPSYMDANKIQFFDTTRVRPAPNPPARHMVQLMPEAPSQAPGTSGRFTLLTYNLLADLYAKVGAAPSMHARLHGRMGLHAHCASVYRLCVLL